MKNYMIFPVVEESVDYFVRQLGKVVAFVLVWMGCIDGAVVVVVIDENDY